MYFFDLGVARTQAGLPPAEPKSKDFGDAMEHWILHEIKTWTDYHESDMEINYWRSVNNFEVDFLVDQRIAIEVKAKVQIQNDDCKGLRAIAEEGIKQLLIVSLESQPRIHQGIRILPWRNFITELWSGMLLRQERS